VTEIVSVDTVNVSGVLDSVTASESETEADMLESTVREVVHD
jgi:hypothetical protein